MPKRRDPRAGGKIKDLTDRDKFNAGKKSRSTDDDFEWKVVRGILKLVKKR
jgi:hypothetical protein